MACFSLWFTALGSSFLQRAERRYKDTATLFCHVKWKLSNQYLRIFVVLILNVDQIRQTYVLQTLLFSHFVCPQSRGCWFVKKEQKKVRLKSQTTDIDGRAGVYFMLYYFHILSFQKVVGTYRIKKTKAIIHF